MSGDAHLLGVRDHNVLDMRRDHRRDRECAGRFVEDHVLLVNFFAKASRG
jgi:hypothetical protein